MFSSAQKYVLDSLIPTMVERGFHYYVAYTNTSVNTDYSSVSLPDLYVVFSSEEITATSAYSYNVPSGSVRYTIRTANYSLSRNANNSERVVVSSFSGKLSIDPYEHIYTNATSEAQIAVQPDILKEGSVNFEYSAFSSFLLGSLLFYLIIKDMWHTGQSYRKRFKNK